MTHKTDPRYIPPVIEGYVWWSNMVRDDQNRLIPLDDIGRQYCVMTSATSLRVPESAIRVEPFTPDDGWDVRQWTVYVKEAYASNVSEHARDLLDRLRRLMKLSAMEGQDLGASWR